MRDLTQRDMTVTYGERTFAIRAYRHDDAWHSVIVEGRTPLHSWSAPCAEAAACFAVAVGFVAAVVDAAVARTEDLG
jgi:hypothetical protein